MLRVAVAGASGYMGAEALRLLSVHPKLQLSVVTSERLAGERLDKVFPHLRGLSSLVFSDLDPARLSERWFRDVIATGLGEEEYVETVSIVAHVVAIDTMARGIGFEPLPLPQPRPGQPSQYRPGGAKRGDAWVPWIEPPDLSAVEAGIYSVGRPAANIMKAMSLVPDEVRSFFDIVSHQYQGPLEMRDFSHEYRAISHAQIELLAARVSALNQCLY